MVYAFDSTTNLPKTGDAANITAYVSKDWGTVTVLGDTSATEMDATNAKGFYLFDATQAETNAEVLMVSAKSSTANIVVIGAPAVIFTLPTTGVLAPATLGRVAVVDASGLIDSNAVKIGPTGAGTAQTAADAGSLVAKFAGITVLAQWLGLLAGKQVGNSTARTELRATGAGSGTFDETTDALEALRDRGDAAWTGGGGSIVGVDNIGQFTRKYNTLSVTGTTAIRFQVGKVGGGYALAADWTPATGDVKRSLDGAAEGNVTNLPSYVAGAWEWIPTAAELSCKQLTLRIADAATKVISDGWLVVLTFGDPTNAFFPDDFSATAGVAQTGDSYAIINDGTNGNAAIKTAVAGVQSDTDNIQTRIPAALTTNGNMKSSVMEFLATALTETSGQIAAAFKQFFNIGSPTGTVNLTPTTTNLTTNNDKTGYTLSAAGIQAIYDFAASLLTTASSIGKLLKDFLSASTAQTGDAYGLLNGAQTEPAAVPASNASPVVKIGYVFAKMRNKRLTTATTDKLRNDGDSADIASATISDDGTTFTKTKDA